MDPQKPDGKSPSPDKNKSSEERSFKKRLSESKIVRNVLRCLQPPKKPRTSDTAPAQGENREELTSGRRDDDVKMKAAAECFEPSYLEMVELMEKQDLLFAAEDVECPLCSCILLQGDGVMLRACLHTFCRPCLVKTIQSTNMTLVKCPYPDDCDCSIQEKEIKAIISPEAFEQYLSRSLNLAENQFSNSFHCRTPGCTGWCVVDDNAKVFNCPVCKKSNLIVESSDEETGEPLLAKLQRMDTQDLLCYSKAAEECRICFTSMAKGEGVVLRECLHVFCRDCLAHCVQFGDESTATVQCPYREGDDNVCGSSLQEREVKALVPPEVFEKYLSRSVNLAEHHSDNSFHCRTPDCTGWCVYEDGVNVFECPVCKKNNCITCAAIHEGMNCLEYQRDLEYHAGTDKGAKKSLDMLKKMIADGKAMHCPKCQIVLIKNGGCDGLSCTYCKTEICWATKGFRWGPGGKGDLSGGCRCMVNGKQCHPNCAHCH